jgi:hypothetical protein
MFRWPWVRRLPPRQELVLQHWGSGTLPLTNLLPAPAAFGGLRPNRPRTGGAGGGSGLNQLKLSLETNGLAGSATAGTLCAIEFLT